MPWYSCIYIYIYIYIYRLAIVISFDIWFDGKTPWWLLKDLQSVLVVATGTSRTPQTVMLGGIPPSIQHGRGLWARNLPLLLMIGEWGWGVLIYIDTEEHTRICLVRNHSLWSGRMTGIYVREITGWYWVESFQTQRGCWVKICGVLGGNCMGK